MENYIITGLKEISIMLGEILGTTIDFISDQLSKNKLSKRWVLLFALALLLVIFAIIAIMEGHAALAMVFLILSLIPIVFYIRKHMNRQ